MMTVRRWRQLKRHPLSANYEDITGRAFEQMVENLRLYGIQRKRKIVLHEGQVIDGWQLYRACLEADIRPDFEPLKLAKGQTAEVWVECANDLRRHETQERAMQRADERRERVVRAREEGESIRSIAEAEGVAQTTIQRDLEASTVPGGTVDEVKGRDGKIRPATRDPIVPSLREKFDAGLISPKLAEQTAQLTRNQQTVMVEAIDAGMNPKQALSKAQEPSPEAGEDRPGRRRPSTNGQEVWAAKPFKAAFAAFYREVTRLEKAYKCKESPQTEGLRRRLIEWEQDFKALQKQLHQERTAAE